MAYDPFPGIISAGFTATPESGQTPLDVQFVDQSEMYAVIDENDATDLIVETGTAPDIVQEVGY